jgi:hypothetical protein
MKEKLLPIENVITFQKRDITFWRGEHSTGIPLVDRCIYFESYIDVVMFLINRIPHTDLG